MSPSPIPALRRLSGHRSSRWIATVSAVVGLVYLWLFTPFSMTSLVNTGSRNGLAIVVVLARVPQAIAVVRQEHERTAAEREAFEQFARQIADLEPAQAAVSASAVGGSTDDGSVAVATAKSPVPPTGDSLEDVREAYSETVMSVPHYDAEYDESLTENMAKEFGSELAHAVSSEGPVTPQLQQALITASTRSKEERATFLRRLEEEREAVLDARRSLRDVHERVEAIEESLHRRSAQELVNTWDRLDKLEQDCEAVLSDRQASLQAAETAMASIRLQQYLYGPQKWTYPVLGDTLDSIDHVQNVKHQVVTAFSRWR